MRLKCSHNRGYLYASLESFGSSWLLHARVCSLSRMMESCTKPPSWLLFHFPRRTFSTRPCGASICLESSSWSRVPWIQKSAGSIPHKRAARGSEGRGRAEFALLLLAGMHTPLNHQTAEFRFKDRIMKSQDGNSGALN